MVLAHPIRKHLPQKPFGRPWDHKEEEGFGSFQSTFFTPLSLCFKPMNLECLRRNSSKFDDRRAFSTTLSLKDMFLCTHPSNQVDDATLRTSHPCKLIMLKHGTLDKFDLELEQPTTNPWPHFFARSKGHLRLHWEVIKAKNSANNPLWLQNFCQPACSADSTSQGELPKLK